MLSQETILPVSTTQTGTESVQVTDTHLPVVEDSQSITTEAPQYEAPTEVAHPGYTMTTEEIAAENALLLQAEQDKQNKMAESLAAINEAKLTEKSPLLEQLPPPEPINLRELAANVSQPEPPQVGEPKKSSWNWSNLDIRTFMSNFAEQFKLGKVVDVAKKIASVPKKLGTIALRWWNNVSASTSTPTQTPTAA